jgi:AcrR family transcriptional regulator
MTTPQRRESSNSAPKARVSKAERRRQLVAHARHLFTSRGYADTTPEMVAGAAGVSPTILSRHFETKKALFLGVLHEIQSSAFLRWQTETEALTDPLAQLQRMAELFLGGLKRLTPEVRLLQRTMMDEDDEEIVAALREFYRAGEALLERVIAEGQQSGVFRRSLDPRIGAGELIRTALGYAFTLPLGNPFHAEPDALPQAIACMLHCLLKTDV